MSLAAHGTRGVAAVTLVHVVTAGARGVEAVDDVGGVNVGEPLRRHDLEVDPLRTAEMILEVPLSSLADMNEGDLVGTAIYDE